MEKEQKQELIKIIVGIVMLFVLIAVEHSGILPEAVTESRLMLIPFLVPYLISGLDVIKGAIKGIAERELLDEKFLMTVATLGAFYTGEYAEGVAVMLFYQLGEWFQDYAVDKSRDSIKGLMDLAPDKALRINDSGNTEEVDTKDIKVGDIILLRTGDKVPADGVVTEGEGFVDTSAITGESLPADIRPGEPIISGSINGDTTIKYRVEKEYSDSTVSKILELVENASEKKSKTEKFITRFAEIYTPVVVAAAVLVAIVPPLIGMGTFSTWIYRACSFLVISCPCAIVLSVPLAFFGGVGAASRKGVLVKGSNYLELLGGIDTLVTDKTGTLTKGEFAVSKVIAAPGVTEEEVLEVAAHAENFSNHPIALSIKNAYGKEVDTAKVSEVENSGGRGIRANVAGAPVVIGSLAMMEESGVEIIELGKGSDGEASGSTSVYVSRGGKLIGEIRIEDQIKENAGKAIKEMKKEGVREIVMLTGDREKTAESVASALDIDRTFHSLLPQEKVEKMESLISGDRVTCFVGDGVNDAPVLMRSDVGIAMGSLGSDAAIEAADVVIMDDDIEKIPKVIRIAKKTLGIAKMNITFALLVKALILVLSVFGISNMWFAVFADVGVAILCILNSMRVR